MGLKGEGEGGGREEEKRKLEEAEDCCDSLWVPTYIKQIHYLPKWWLIKSALESILVYTYESMIP